MRHRPVELCLVAAAAASAVSSVAGAQAVDHAEAVGESPVDSDIPVSVGRLLFGTHRAAPWQWWLATELMATGQAVGHERDPAIGVLLDTGIDASYEYGRFSSRAATGATFELRAEPGVGPVGLSHWAFVRPYEIGLFRFELAHELLLEARPALSRRPDLWRHAFTREHIGVEVTGLHYLGDRFGGEFLRVAEGFDFTWQLDGEERTRRFATTSDWSILSLLLDPGGGREIARLDLMSLEAEAIDDDRDAVAFSTMYVRVSDAPIGPLPIAVDAAWGEAATGYAILQSEGHEKVIETEDLPDVSGMPVCRGSVHGHLGDLSLAVDAGSELFLTMDVNLAREERLGLRAGWERAVHSVSAELFRAETRLWTDADSSEDWVTGGAALRYERHLERGWEVALSAEAARSFYAELDGARAPAVGDALRLGVGLARHIGGGSVASEMTLRATPTL